MTDHANQAQEAEKRQLKRRHLIYYLRVYDRGSNQVVGHLVDITREGARLISESPIPVGRQFQLRMLLPAEIFGRSQLEFEAESLWTKADINPDFHDTGFRLLNMEGRDRLVIARLIDEYGFRD